MHGRAVARFHEDAGESVLPIGFVGGFEPGYGVSEDVVDNGSAGRVAEAGGKGVIGGDGGCHGEGLYSQEMISSRAFKVVNH